MSTPTFTGFPIDRHTYLHYTLTEWKAVTVVAIRQINTRSGVYPIGFKFEIVDKKNGKFTVRGRKACDCCGVLAIVSSLEPGALQVADEE